MKPSLLSFAAALLLAAACSSPAPAQNADADEVFEVDADDPEMDAAIAEAQRTLPEFLAVLADPPPGASELQIKFPLAGWEHIGVDELEHRGDRIVGRLANNPVEEGYRRGDRVSVPLADVSDWAWRDADGVMQGNRTTRVILARMAPAEAAPIREYLGW